MIVRSKAPLRIGLAGGGSDVSPYSDKYGGYVLNATIGMYAHCTIQKLDDKKVIFDAKDIGVYWEEKARPIYELDGDLILHKAIYNRVVKRFNRGEPLNIKVITFVDAPPGSGLGSSSTMVVAILSAYRELLNLPLGEYDLAHLAFEIERIDCGLAGGKQDQYAATFGGFNFIEFYESDKVIVNPLRIRRSIINELEAHLILFFTGQSRDSARIIEDQIELVSADKDDALEAMHKVKDNAWRMKEALLKSNIVKMSDLLGESWCSKKKTSSVVSNKFIEKIYESAIRAGANSAKVSGAGGGGFMMFFVEPAKRIDVEKVLTSFSSGNGTFIYKINFTEKGVESWKV